MANYTLDLTGDQVNAALKEVHNNTVVKKTAQTFTDAEKSQIRENIGAGSGADVAAISEKIGNETLPTIEQTLTGAIAELDSDLEELGEKTVNGYAMKDNVELKAKDIPFESSPSPEAGSLEEKIQDIDAELAEKANQDGFYHGMGVGNAEQLISTVGVIDKVPYNFRTAGGSADIGNRLNDKLVGGTIAWNQCFRVPTFTSDEDFTDGVKFINNRDGSITVVIDEGGATANKSKNLYVQATDYISSRANHKILVLTTNNSVGLDTGYWFSTSITRYTSTILQLSSNPGYAHILAYVPQGTGAGTYTVYFEFFDLTQMFGSTIADYIYSLEQATTGAGVAWFKKLFPKPYYEYNAGELMSVCTNAHITRGFNAWDEEWELGSIDGSGHDVASGSRIRGKNFNKCIANSSYYAKGAELVYFYDANRNFISRAEPNLAQGYIVTSPDNTAYFRIRMSDTYGATYNHDICINLSWSGYRNGEYEPYVEHRYPLSPIELRGIPKLDSANNLYYDGDTYEKDGTVTRKYGELILDDIQAQIVSDTTWLVYLEGKKFITDNMRSERYIAGNAFSEVNAYTQDGNNDIIYINTGSSVNKPSGKFVYELATPTTETANPFTDPQIVDDFGTEEYIDALATAETNPRDVAVPVGHETFYQVNLRDKLQNLPENANADGLYLIKQTGNKQELIAYTPESELPALPSDASTKTYGFKSVNGVLTWVAE